MLTPLPLESHHSVSEPNPCIEYAMMLHTCDVEGGGGGGGKALRLRRGITAAACTSPGISPATDIFCGIPLDPQIDTIILHVSTKQTSAYSKRRYIQNIAAGAPLRRKTLSFGAGGPPRLPLASPIGSKGAPPSPFPSPQVSPPPLPNLSPRRLIRAHAGRAVAFWSHQRCGCSPPLAPILPPFLF